MILRLKQQLMATEHADYPMMSHEQRVSLSRALAAAWERSHGPEHTGTLHARAQLARALSVSEGPLLSPRAGGPCSEEGAWIEAQALFDTAVPAIEKTLGAKEFWADVEKWLLFRQFP